MEETPFHGDTSSGQGLECGGKRQSARRRFLLIRTLKAMFFSVDRPETKWDNPTMTTTADSKKRIVLPTARPGDIFDICRLGEGRFMILRLERPELPSRPLTRAQSLKAIAAAPLRMQMDWETLKKVTREP